MLAVQPDHDLQVRVRLAGQGSDRTGDLRVLDHAAHDDALPQLHVDPDADHQSCVGLEQVVVRLAHRCCSLSVSAARHATQAGEPERQ